MNKLFFIVGIRRSGTSILRTLLMKHPEISTIEYEPHPLLFAVDMNHFDRFKKIPYVQNVLKNFRKKGSANWHGAKIALNPGIKAMEWMWLPQTFPTAKFIFIIRNPQNTYKSYVREDKKAVRGYLPESIYFPSWKILSDSFEIYTKIHPKKSCLIHYEMLISNPDRALQWICDLLQLRSGLSGMKRHIQKPRFK